MLIVGERLIQGTLKGGCAGEGGLFVGLTDNSWIYKGGTILDVFTA